MKPESKDRVAEAQEKVLERQAESGIGQAPVFLRIDKARRELGSFTRSELAEASGASYDSVREAVDWWLGDCIEKIGTTDSNEEIFRSS